MPTSPHADAYRWDEPAGVEQADHSDHVEVAYPDAIGQPTATGGLDDDFVEIPAGHVRVTRSLEVDSYEARPVTAPAAITEYSAAPGMPARGVILISTASSLGCALLDVALTGGLGMFFNLCFVTICLVSAMAIRPRDLFTAGVLAPFSFGAAIALVAVLDPPALAPAAGPSQAFLTGLAAHAGALVAGYALALATVGGRVVARRQRSAMTPRR